MGPSAGPHPVLKDLKGPYFCSQEQKILVLAIGPPQEPSPATRTLWDLNSSPVIPSGSQSSHGDPLRTLVLPQGPSCTLHTHPMETWTGSENPQRVLILPQRISKDLDPLLRTLLRPRSCPNDPHRSPWTPQDFTPALEILMGPHQSHMSLHYLRVTTHVICRTAPSGPSPQPDPVSYLNQ